jgi:hypothetical protein
LKTDLSKHPQKIFLSFAIFLLRVFEIGRKDSRATKIRINSGPCRAASEKFGAIRAFNQAISTSSRLASEVHFVPAGPELTRWRVMSETSCGEGPLKPLN